MTDAERLARYRAALAHMAAHRRWSTAIFADNYSPLQRLAIEALLDVVDALIIGSIDEQAGGTPEAGEPA